MDMNDFSKMPIFNNFPMMAPHEFINLIAAEEIKKLDSEEMFNKNSFSAFDEPQKTDFKDNSFVSFKESEIPEEEVKETSFTAFNEKKKPENEIEADKEMHSFVAFNDVNRPESIPPVSLPELKLPEPSKSNDDELAAFLDVYKEEQEVQVEDRPVRRPRPQRPNPNHRYPIHPYAPQTTPFTAKPKSHIVDHSYIRNSYRHQQGKACRFLVVYLCKICDDIGWYTITLYSKVHSLKKAYLT